MAQRDLITPIRIYAHGTSSYVTLSVGLTQGLNDNDNRLTVLDDKIEITYQNTVNPSLSASPLDITTLLRNAMAPGGEIDLDACQTALISGPGQTCLAKQMSQLLSGVLVVGSTADVFENFLYSATQGWWDGYLDGKLASWNFLP